MRIVKIGLLGFGNIGTGVYRIISECNEMFKKEGNFQIIIKKALVRDLTKKRGSNISREIFTKNIEDILDDDEISIVIEVLGGVEPAKEYIIKALENKKSVITANKEVLARNWELFNTVASKNKVGIYYEASVGAGIPVVKVLSESMQANKINEIMGIINGTTNYILTKMADNAEKFEKVLKEAQNLGYAEPDPTADVSGLDVMYKLSILSSIAFKSNIQLNRIYREGITNISNEDIEYGKELGFTLKLLAISKYIDNKVECRVHPTFLHENHPLASVRDSYNAVFIRGNFVDDIMLYGRGAGDLPTGSAIVSDIVTCINNEKHKYFVSDNSVDYEDDWETEFFIRMSVKDRPGVLSSISGIFGKFDVSIASVIQKDRTGDIAPLIFVTHKAREKSIEKAIIDMKFLEEVIKIDNVIRVER